MKTISGIEFASEHNGTDVFRLIELAYEQGQKDGHSEQLGTNLAEVGTDCISRQAAIDTLENTKTAISEDGERYIAKQNAIMRIDALPSAQPDIIRCRNCKFASGDSRICMKFGHSPIGELDFCAWAERRTDGRFNQQTGGD